MSHSKYFSPDYTTARERFREAAHALGWQCEAHRLEATSAVVEELTIDVAIGPSSRQQTLVLSSGVHGAEAPFGSAVQLGLLEAWQSGALPRPACRVVMIHAVNPFGFAEIRRFNEDNVDLNRNFLLPGEAYAGAPPKYGAMDRLLNPPRDIPRLDAFPLHAMTAIVRYGMPALMQTIAAGQYEFPRGLFFGGHAPAASHRILLEHMPRWLSGSRDVIHLDFHTGLGAHGSHELLIDYPLTARHRQELVDWFGSDVYFEHGSDDSLYVARGGFGQWCVGHHFAPHYLFATAEFGTYPPVRIVSGLRRENQAHHFGDPRSPRSIAAKQRLLELFCPGAASWRERVLHDSFNLVQRSLDGLASHV